MKRPASDLPPADRQLAGENNPRFDPRTGRLEPDAAAPEPVARRMGRDRVVTPRRPPRGREPSEG